MLSDRTSAALRRRYGHSSDPAPTGTTDHSTNPTVVEYAVQTMIKRGWAPAAAAKDTAKRLGGYTNMFISPGQSTSIDVKVLEEALWERLTDRVIRGISHFKQGKEDYALDGTLTEFHQKPAMRSKLRARVVAKLGHDPFPQGT